MALQKLLLKSGTNTEATPTLAEGTWVETNCIRFRDGYLEKMLGWQPLAVTPVMGTARSMHGWSDTDGIVYIAIGTNTNLMIIWNGNLDDITPLRATVNIAVAFSTTDGETEVTITDTAHGANVGDQVNIVTPVSVGGIVMSGYYTITSIVDADNYTVEAADAATATVSGGGAVADFDTTNLDSEVLVTFADHGFMVGQQFTVYVSTAVGGLTLNGSYLILTVPDADTLTFDAGSAASSTTSGFENGGNVRIEYLISPGPASTMITQGYGTGGYGLGPWGIGDPGSTFLLPLRYWFLENFGVTLIASMSNGPMYEWTPPYSTTPRATAIVGPPTINTAMFIAMPALQVISLGAEVLGVQDPLLVRWSDAGSYTDWIATTTNQAGSYRLSHGSRIVGGIQGALAGLIWTDDALWQMQYIQPPLVYTFTIVAHGCGLIAPKAMGLLGRDVFWMSVRGFYRYGSGAPEQLPCPVWDTVFLDLDTANMDKCICGVNSAENEVMWFFPSISGGTGEIDSYVKLAVETGDWDYGPAGTLLARTAWGSDASGTSLPVSIDLSRYAQEQELGFNAGETAAMTGVRAKSAYLDIEDGKQMYRVDQIIPDFKMLGTDPTLRMTLHVLDHPNGTPREFGPYTITQDTQYFSIVPAARGRQVAVEIEMDGADMWFRLGAVRIRTAPSGVRPQSGG